MRSISLLVSMLTLAVGGPVGCGAQTGSAASDTSRAPEPGALLTTDWVGGGALRATGASSRLRALAFFPGTNDGSAERLARTLARLAERYEQLEVIGATRSTAKAQVEALRKRTGFPGPIALGVEDAVFKHYAVGQPSVRVIDREGRLVGRDLVTLCSLLEARP
jgi:hypothetical protein